MSLSARKSRKARPRPEQRAIVLPETAARQGQSARGQKPGGTDFGDRTMLRCVAPLAILIGLSSPAFAQEGALFKNLFQGGGLFGDAKEEIEYRERAPLVVPPSMKLPAPQQRAAQRNANALLPATEREKYREQRNPVLSQEELRRGRDPSQRVTVPYKPASENANEQLIQPIIVGREIAAQRNAKDDLSTLDGVEPPRKYLSDPPSGLRRPLSGVARTREVEAPANNRDSTNQKEFAQGQIRR
jgi:hypothetical protein